MKIELHAHTSQSSGCGQLPAEELVGRYKGAGYETIVVTDHFAGRKDGEASRSARIEKWLTGWRAAKKAGDRIGLNVLMGAEMRFATTGCEDILIFGMKEEYAEDMMAVLDADAGIEALYRAAHERGMLVVQAHPFRPGLVQFDHAYLDGVEVYNGHPHHNSRNDLALEYGLRGGADFLRTSGSDAHEMDELARGGVISPMPIRTNEELVEFLKNMPDMVRIET